MQCNSERTREKCVDYFLGATIEEIKNDFKFLGMDHEGAKFLRDVLDVITPYVKDVFKSVYTEPSYGKKQLWIQKWVNPSNPDVPLRVDFMPGGRPNTYKPNYYMRALNHGQCSQAFCLCNVNDSDVLLPPSLALNITGFDPTDRGNPIRKRPESNLLWEITPSKYTFWALGINIFADMGDVDVISEYNRCAQGEYSTFIPIYRDTHLGFKWDRNSNTLYDSRDRSGTAKVFFLSFLENKMAKAQRDWAELQHLMKIAKIMDNRRFNQGLQLLYPTCNYVKVPHINGELFSNRGRYINIHKQMDEFIDYWNENSADMKNLGPKVIQAIGLQNIPPNLVQKINPVNLYNMMMD